MPPLAARSTAHHRARGRARARPARHQPPIGLGSIGMSLGGGRLTRLSRERPDRAEPRRSAGSAYPTNEEQRRDGMGALAHGGSGPMGIMWRISHTIDRSMALIVANVIGRRLHPRRRGWRHA